MNQKNEDRKDDAVQGIEMIDLGDAMVETKQPGAIQWVPDTCCSYTYLAE